LAVITRVLQKSETPNFIEGELYRECRQKSRSRFSKTNALATLLKVDMNETYKKKLEITSIVEGRQ
jgi:hypothetical protein